MGIRGRGVYGANGAPPLFQQATPPFHRPRPRAEPGALWAKWPRAFLGTDAGSVRRALDRGEPVPGGGHGDMVWGVGTWGALGTSGGNGAVGSLGAVG